MADDHAQLDRFDAGGAPPPGAGLRTGPPWEAAGYSVESFFSTARQALLDPTQFFRSLRREGGLGAPLVFGLIGITLGFIVGSLLQTTMFRLPIGMPHEVEQMAGDLAMMMALIVIGPFLALVSLFVSSAISHLMLLLLGGARTFETTFRVVGYSAGSTGLVAMVPFCGGIVSAIWQVVILIIGLARAHEISTGRAAAAVLLPAIICCVAVMLTIGAIMAMVAAGLSSLGGV